MNWLVKTVSHALNALFLVNLKRVGLVFFGVLFFSLTLQWAVSSKWRLGMDFSTNRCLPFYLYLMFEGDVQDIKVGEMVRFDPGQRMYVKNIGTLNQGKEVIKIVAAQAGEQVQITKDVILVNGIPLHESSTRLQGIPLQQHGLNAITASKLGKPMEAFERVFTVPPGQVFLVSTLNRSYDSRYWGTLPETAIRARVKPLW